MKVNNISISQNGTIEDIIDVFGGALPESHPESFVARKILQNQTFVAFNEENPVGFLFFEILWGNTPYLELLKIKEEYRRQGIGFKLLESCISELKNLGFKFLNSSTETINDLGKGFHQKYGFKEIGKLQMQHGEEIFFNLNFEDFNEINSNKEFVG